MSSNNNNNNSNNQFPSQFGQNTTSDQNQQFSGLPGGTGTAFNAPSGTHAQQHNLHNLNTPLTQPGSTTTGGGHNLEQEAMKLQSEMERSHPHQQTGGHSSNPFTQNQGQLHQNHGAGPLSSQPAAHNTTGGTVLTGVGAGVTGLPTGGNSDPYSTTTMGGTGNHGHPTTLPGTGMSIGGQQHHNQGSNLPVSGSVLDHAKDNRHQFDQSKSEQAGVDRDRAARQLASGHHDHTTGTGMNHGTTGFNNNNNNNNFSSQGQHHKGPLETMGVAGATGRGDTTTHGTTNTGTHSITNTGTHGTGTHGTGTTHGTGAHGTDFDSSNRHQTTGGLTSTEGRKDGDRLAQDTRATNAGHTAHNATSDPAAHKPSLGDKIAAKAEKIQGKITGNPALVAKGEQREQGFGPKN